MAYRLFVFLAALLFAMPAMAADKVEKVPGGWMISFWSEPMPDGKMHKPFTVFVPSEQAKDMAAALALANKNVLGK